MVEEYKIEWHRTKKSLEEKIQEVEKAVQSKDFDKLIQLLYSESWHTRILSAKFLVEMFPEKSKEKVRKMLNEDYWFVRAISCYILGELKDAESLQEILKLLNERNQWVKIQAAVAVVKILISNPNLHDLITQDQKLNIENMLKTSKNFELLKSFRESREAKSLQVFPDTKKPEIF